MSDSLSIERERELIALAQQGDHRAFAELARDAQRRMWAVALTVTGNQHDAEDALQNALTAIWRNLDRFEPRARFSTWAYRITSNAALQVVRSRRETLDPDAGLEEASTDSAVDSQVTSAMVVRTALAQLPDDFRQALVLREYGGLSYQEIAEQQAIPVQTVKSRINRGRTQLRAALVELGVDGG